MKIIEIEAFLFDELSDEAKDKAVNNLSDINTAYDWWDGVYLDAENIGLKIASFELDRGREAKGAFIDSALDTAKLIIANHGAECESYKTAAKFISEFDELILSTPLDSDGDMIDGREYDLFLEDLENEFEQSLLEDYSIMLQKECDYLTSRAAIIETIESNECYFDENGKLV